MYNLICADGYHFGGQGDVYVLDLYRLSTGLAAISSDQKLTLFNPARLGQGPVRSLPTNHGNLTCLKTYNAAESIVCTAGENGQVSVWDLREGSKPQIAHFGGRPEPGCGVELVCFRAGFTNIVSQQAKPPFSPWPVTQEATQ